VPQRALLVHGEFWRCLRHGIVQRIGPWNLALSAAALSAALTAIILGVGLLRQRRRLRALVDRIEQLEADEASDLLDRAERSFRRAWELHPPFPEAQMGLDEVTALRAVAFIRANLSQSITVPQLARAATVSVRSLHRALQERFQCTPKELVTAIKMRAAMGLLRSGEWQVKDVAYQVGFANPYHFSRRFKEVFGVPPSSVRPGQ